METADIVATYLRRAFPAPEYGIVHRSPDRIDHEFLVQGNALDVMLRVPRSFLDDNPDNSVVLNLLRIYHIDDAVRRLQKGSLSFDGASLREDHGDWRHLRG